MLKKKKVKKCQPIYTSLYNQSYFISDKTSKKTKFMACMMRASAVKYYFEEHESHNRKRNSVCAQKRSMTETMVATLLQQK